MKTPQTFRRRNISWKVDYLARKLAFDKRMSVSKLLELLIIAESERENGIAPLRYEEAAQ